MSFDSGPDFMAQHLWYVRKKGDISGPFPAPQIRQMFSLGEIDLRDQVSLDGQQWFTVMESNVLDNGSAKPSRGRPMVGESDEEWQREREKARLRWLNDAVEVRAEEDRPRDEVSSRLRQHEEETRALLTRERNRRPAILAGMASVVVILIIGLAVWFGQSGQQTIQASLTGKVRNCELPPAEGVTWMGCNKDDADLRGANLKNAVLARARFERAELIAADLSYANLDGANMRGANLRGAVLRGASMTQADLTGADLSGANLEFAVMTGAYLEGVRLDGASLRRSTWVDGRICGDDSVGSCR